MFEKILIATDISTNSLPMLECMGQLHSLGTRECLIVECVQSKDAIYGIPEDDGILKTSVNEKKEILQKQGFKTEGVVVIGNIISEINNLAEEKNCSLIVVGIVRLSLAREIFFADITNFIAKNTKKPVLIVPVKKEGETLLGEIADYVIQKAVRPILKIPVKSEKEGVQFSLQCSNWDIKRHILFPTDFSTNADKAFSYLKEIVKTGAEKVTLFHVQDKEKIGKDFKQNIQKFDRIDKERLQNLKKNIKGAKKVDIQISYGAPEREIMDFISKNKVSQLVMGSQGRGYIKEIFMGSVSHKISRISKVPVILVPMQK